MPLILGRPYVNARIDVGAERIQFRIGRNNMTFTFQAKEEQCYLVQDEESREWRKPQPQYKEDEVSPTKPKVFKGRHQTRKPKAINKAKGEKKMEAKNTPAKAPPTSAPPKKTKKVWRVKKALSESSNIN
jgi:hypothetical protein